MLPFIPHTDLNALIAKLDRRSSRSEQSGRHFKCLRRELSTPVDCEPPTDTPKWAVDPETRSRVSGDDGQQLDPPLFNGDMYHFPEVNSSLSSDSDFALQGED